MDAVRLLLAASTAVMSVSWGVCSFTPVCTCLCVCWNNACYSVLISYDDRRNEDAGERRGRRHSTQPQVFCRRTALLP